MRKLCKLLLKTIGAGIALAATAFAAVQAVYWLNLDNKFMFVLHHVLNKITDRVPRDRKF